MKTFSHGKGNTYILRRAGRFATEIERSYIGKAFTLVQVEPCSYNLHRSNIVPGTICFSSSASNFVCPGKMKFEEYPFNIEPRCFGHKIHDFDKE